MSFPLPTGSTFAVHMRCPTSSGGKDWVGSINGTTITSQWGKTGAISQEATKHGSDYALDKIIAEKQAKGYVIVDTYRSPRGWDTGNSSAAAAVTQEEERMQATMIKEKRPREPLKSIMDDVTKPDNAMDWDF